MEAFAGMDRWVPLVRPPLQSSEPAAWQTSGTMRNLQTGTVGASYPYRTPNTAARPPQSYQSLSSDWQTGTTSCRQTPAGVGDPNYWRMNANCQSGNPHFMASRGAQQGFPPNCPQSSWSQSPSHGGTASMPNTGVFLNYRPGSTSAANSFYPQPHSDTLPPTSHDLNHRGSSTQDRFSSAVPPPDYFSAVHQPFRNITTNSSSSQEVFSRSQRTQPNQAQVSHSGRYDTSGSSRTDRLPLYSSDETRERMIAKIADHLRNSVSAGLDSHPAAYGGNQYVSQNQTTESNHHTQPTGNNSYNSPVCYAQPSPETSRSRRVSPLQRSAANRPAAKRRKAAEEGPVQTSSDASLPWKTTPMLTAMLTGGSVHSSPGTRAVAVVQPLLQESCQQDVRPSRSPDVIIKPTEHAAGDEFRKRASVSPEESKELPTGSDESKTGDSSALTQNQPTDPEPAAVIQDQRHVSPAPQDPAAEVTESQSRDQESRVTPTDPPESPVELSSFPTIQCTPGVMKNIINEQNKVNYRRIRESKYRPSTMLLMDKFWDGDPKAFIRRLKDCRNNISVEAAEFCSEHVTKDTVISGVKGDGWKALEGHRILKHGEEYTEPPYQPFWLTVDEKLDGIEKEFGLPWPLRRRPRTPESDIHLDAAEIVDSISEEILKEVSNTVLALTEQQPVDFSGGESSGTDETTSIKPAESPESSDPLSALEIKVLPPEEALLIFEQAAMSSEAQPEREASGSAEAERQEVINRTLGDSEPEGAAVSPIEQVCCIQRFERLIYGPSTALSPCKCQSEKDPQEVSEACDEEGDLKSDELHVISSDHKSESTEEERPAPGEESYDTQTIIYVETVDSLEDGVTNSFHEELNSNQLSAALLSEVEDGGPVGCENRAPEQVDADAPGEFTGPVQSSERETRDLSRAVAEGESSREKEALWSLKTREPVGLHTSPQAVERKQKGLQGHVGSLHSQSKSLKPFVQDSLSEQRKSSSDVKEGKLSSLKYGTAKLALFGSSKHTRCSTVGKTRKIFTPGAESSTMSRPPEVLSVSLSPSKRKFSDAVPAEEPSVKLRIYERWRQSFPPAQIRHKKLKPQKFLSSSAASLKKPDRTGSLKQPLFSEKRTWHVNKFTQRPRLASGRQKSRKGKNKTGRRRQREEVQQTRDAESQTEKPQQENAILKFSVLPKTFNFKEEPHGTESTILPAPNTTNHADGKSSNTTVTGEKGTWSKHSEKKYRPLHGKTSGVFQEYQQKYKKLMQQK